MENENIANRILKVVNKLGGNMSEFARKIDVTPAYISKLGKQPEKCRPSGLVISNICREFNVNKNWLITGEGGDDAMFNPTPESVFDKFAQDLGLEPRDRILIEKFLALPPEGRQAVMDYALSVDKAVKGDVVTQSPPTYQDGDEEDYADIARRQRLSEKEQAAQVSSAKELGVG